MIGPADIEDMMLDYAASNTRAADHGEPEGQLDQHVGWASWICPVMLLAFEAQRVIELRLVRLAWGGQEGRDEMTSMVTEKIATAIEAAGTLMGGGSFERVISRYREHVAANTNRLAKLP